MPIPGKINTGYDWTKTLTSAAKAGAYVALGVIVYDPSLIPALSGLVPEQYRQLAALVVPAVVAAVQNWLRNRGNR